MTKPISVPLGTFLLTPAKMGVCIGESGPCKQFRLSGKGGTSDLQCLVIVGPEDVGVSGLQEGRGCGKTQMVLCWAISLFLYSDRLPHPLTSLRNRMALVGTGGRVGVRRN